MKQDSILSVQNISKTFDDAVALKGISLEVMRGEFLTLLGPSGCGKTTTLRIISGLESPDLGEIILDGVDVTNTEPNKRNVNTVFQSYALFPHMNVEQNIAYGLKLKKLPKAEIDKRVQEMLELVQLEGYGKRMPSQLSGGQRQRVAIARAIVNSPSVLLLDEPLGALDLQLRKQMQFELKRLQKRLGITFIYITHDQEEALNMSDRIGIMNAGEIVQLGTPDEIYNHPQNRFAAQFIGQSNIIEAEVLDRMGEELLLEYAGGKIRALGDAEIGEKVALCIRTERVDYSESVDGGFSLRGIVKEYFYSGGLLRTTIAMDNGDEMIVTAMRDDLAHMPTDTRVNVFWNPQKAVIVERRIRDEE